METVHDKMDLQSGRIVDFRPYSTEVLLGTGFEDTAVEPMTYDMRGGRDSSQTSANDNNVWPHKMGVCGGGGVGESTKSR
jgi:hypothetical protein